MISLTPVALHRKLHVEGANLVDEKGEIMQLRGLSTHGIAWYPGIVSEDSFRTFRDDWKVNALRLAMYVEEAGYNNCYLNDKKLNMNLVCKGIDLCIKLGLYVMVDWHILMPGDPSLHTDEAIAFFETIAEKYPDCPNLIFEICNEPNGENIKWNNVIRPYCVAVTEAIRIKAPETVIIAGTGTWSQDVHEAIRNPLPDKNTMYSVHYYAATHKQWLRDRIKDCHDKGYAVLISEFGVCDASGNGTNDLEEARRWFDFLDSLGIGYFNWAMGNKDEACCAFRPSTNISAGKWADDDLTESGLYIKNWLALK